MSKYVKLSISNVLSLTICQLQGVLSEAKNFKGAMSRFVHLEKFSLNFSSSPFVIRVNLLHP